MVGRSILEGHNLVHDSSDYLDWRSLCNHMDSSKLFKASLAYLFWHFKVCRTNYEELLTTFPLDCRNRLPRTYPATYSNQTIGVASPFWLQEPGDLGPCQIWERSRKWWSVWRLSDMSEAVSIMVLGLGLYCEIHSNLQVVTSCDYVDTHLSFKFLKAKLMKTSYSSHCKCSKLFEMWDIMLSLLPNQSWISVASKFTFDNHVKSFLSSKTRNSAP